jgi:hypothetical protein
MRPSRLRRVPLTNLERLAPRRGTNSFSGCSRAFQMAGVQHYRGRPGLNDEIGGHSKLESTVRYLGIEVDDALENSEQTEI